MSANIGSIKVGVGLDHKKFDQDLARLRRTLSSFGRSLKNLTFTVKVDTKKVDKAIDRTSRRLKSLSTQMKSSRFALGAGSLAAGAGGGSLIGAGLGAGVGARVGGRVRGSEDIPDLRTPQNLGGVHQAMARVGDRFRGIPGIPNLSIKTRAIVAYGKALNRVKGALGGVGRAMGKLHGPLNGLKKDFKDLRSGIGRLITKFKGPLKVAAAAAGAAIAGIAVSIKTALAAARTEQVGQGFAALAGAGSEKLFKRLEAAAEGTISKFDLLRQANRALLLGVSKDLLPKLIAGSRQIAKATGEDASFLFESIALGIGRQSRMLLDNLGIIVKADAAYKAYAETLGKSSSALTEQEKRAAFTKAALEGLKKRVDSLGSVEDNVVQKQAKLSASWKDLRDTFGSIFLKSGVVAKIFDELQTAIATAVSSGVIEDFGKKMADAISSLPDTIKSATDNLVTLLGIMNRILGVVTKLNKISSNNKARIGKELAPLSKPTTRPNGFFDAQGAANLLGAPALPENLKPKGIGGNIPFSSFQPEQNLGRFGAGGADLGVGLGENIAREKKLAKRFENETFRKVLNAIELPTIKSPNAAQITNKSALAGGFGGLPTLYPGGAVAPFNPFIPIPGPGQRATPVPLDLPKIEAINESLASLSEVLTFNVTNAADGFVDSLMRAAEGTETFKEAMKSAGLDVANAFASVAKNFLSNSAKTGLIDTAATRIGGGLSGLLGKGRGGFLGALGNFAGFGLFGGIAAFLASKFGKKPEEQRQQIVEELQGIREDGKRRNDLIRDSFGFDATAVQFLAASQIGRVTTATRPF